MISCALCKNKKEKCIKCTPERKYRSCAIMSRSTKCQTILSKLLKSLYYCLQNFRDMRMKAIMYATNSPHIYISNILVYEIKPVSF